MIEEIFLERINLVKLDLQESKQFSVIKNPKDKINHEETLRILMVKDFHKNLISFKTNLRLLSISHLFKEDLRFFDCMNNFYEKFRSDLDKELLNLYLESLNFWRKKLK